MHKKTYVYLSEYEREIITRAVSGGDSVRSIARSLHRAPSTVSREIRKGFTRGHYCTDCASRASRIRIRARRLHKYKVTQNQQLALFVREKLTSFWSPVQIAVYSKQAYPHDVSMQVSHEAIYRYLYIRPGKDLRHLLRHGHMYRYKRGRPKKDSLRGKMTDMTLIDERPEEVVSRLIPGHWEGDLIKGKYNKSAIGTLVERSTRFTFIVPLAGVDAHTVRTAFAHTFATLPKALTRSLTYDQGKEMAEHKRFTLDTDIKVYFAHPRSPWERGTNENTNGLIRQFFPKGTDFSKVSLQELQRAQDLLNDRPRKVLGFKKPNEVLSILLR